MCLVSLIYGQNDIYLSVFTILGWLKSHSPLGLPSGYVKIAIEHDPFSSLIYPLYMDGEFPVRKLLVYQRLSTFTIFYRWYN